MATNGKKSSTPQSEKSQAPQDAPTHQEPRTTQNFGLDRADLESMLQARGWYVRCAPVDHKRYVGAQIGIHDLQGRKVGRVSHLRNKELLFMAGEDVEAIDAAYDAVLAPDRQRQLALV